MYKSRIIIPNNKSSRKNKRNYQNIKIHVFMSLMRRIIYLFAVLRKPITKITMLSATTYSGITIQISLKIKYDQMQN